MTTETTEQTDVGNLQDELRGIESARQIAAEEKATADSELEQFHSVIRDGRDVDFQELGAAEHHARAKTMRLQALQQQHEQLSARLDLALTEQERADEMRELRELADAQAEAEAAVQKAEKQVRGALAELKELVSVRGEGWRKLSRRADELLPLAGVDPDTGTYATDSDCVVAQLSRSGTGPWQRHGGITGVTLDGRKFGVAAGYEDVRRRLP